MVVAQRYGAGHRVLITGGAGFVGSHLADALLARGATVVAVDNFSTGGKENVAHLADHPRFTLVEADVTESLPFVEAITSRFDAIMHFASPASPTDFTHVPLEIMRVGSIGTRSVYDESKRFSEAAPMAHHRYRGVDMGIVRIFNTYGERMRPDDGRAIPTFITQALRN